jgi:hypothetical protein
MLKRPGRVMYQACFYIYVNSPMMKVGSVKIPIKQGITNRVPTMYQGILEPHLVLILSLNTPTKGVVIPSHIYPERVAAAVTSGESPMTSFRYHDK